MRVLILRPQPGADETAERARAMGLEPVLAPLFAVRAIAWEYPDRECFDAAFLTSANAARLGGDGLTPFFDLPCYAVGERTAAAADAAGFADLRTGPSDGRALAALAMAQGVKAAIHFCGRDHSALGPPVVAAMPVYSAEPLDRLPPRLDYDVALLHSPRAAALFSALVDDPEVIRIAAISAQAAAAAGGGWRSVSVAEAPRDEALLELAAKLCHTGGQ
jgi:uroporphyrinogen-III synthase